jgi:mRNA interferase MazF
MVISQGDIWWADFGKPRGSAAGYRRPMVVVQGESFNRSGISTVVCVPLTGNTGWANLPGNVMIEAGTSGLDRDSVANVSLITSIDRVDLERRIGVLPARSVEAILDGIDVVLGR